MIHDEPICRPLGDCYLAVEFGDEVSLSLSFRVLLLQEQLSARKVPGVVEICPTVRELAIVYDRTLTSYERLESEVRERLEQQPENATLPSRVITIPVWYDDPWSKEVAERFGVPNNLEVVAEQNGVSKEEFIARHTGTDFWVALVGFTPGCNLHYPLDPDKALVASKYATPRTFTPERAIGMAGAGTCLYPVASPGGYQLVGRSAVGIFDRTGSRPEFPLDGVLIRAGDRIRYRAVGALEYDEIWAAYGDGEWPDEIVEGEFSIAEYEAYVSAMDRSSEPANV